MSVRDRWAVADGHGERDRAGLILSAGAHVMLLIGLVWAGTIARPEQPADTETVQMMFAPTRPDAPAPDLLTPAAAETATASPPDPADASVPVRLDPPVPAAPDPSPPAALEQSVPQLAEAAPPETAAAAPPEAAPPLPAPPVTTPVTEASAELPAVPLLSAPSAPVTLKRQAASPPRPVVQRSAPRPAPPVIAPATVAAPPVQQVAAAAPPHPAAIAPSWRGAVVAWLAAHRRYPESARQEGLEGAVGVAFTLARDGRVLLVSIRRSSGVPVLDAAVLQMLEGQHLPPFPPDMTQAEAEIGVTIRYTLER